MLEKMYYYWTLCDKKKKDCGVQVIYIPTLFQPLKSTTQHELSVNANCLFVAALTLHSFYYEDAVTC